MKIQRNVRLDEELDEKLAREAAHVNVAPATVVNVAVREWYERPSRERRKILTETKNQNGDQTNEQ